jgi:thiol-disulfide isomerase/thioredoxin
MSAWRHYSSPNHCYLLVMKNNLLSLALLAMLVLLTACDKVDGPKVDPAGFAGSSNKVLLDDFTGHLCGFCPRGHTIAAGLKEQYGDNVVVIAVHASGHARVVPFLGFYHDFNTAMGTELENHYRAEPTTGYPIGMVQRRNWDGGPLVDKVSWGTYVAAVLAEAPKLGIDLQATYDPNERAVQVQAQLEYFTTGTAEHYIVAVITEDSIIAKQEDYDTDSSHVTRYVHNHVLRGTITPGTWGVPVKGNRIVLGEKIDFILNATLKPEWVPENCHVVVYVHDNATKEILQVEEIKLME